MSRAAILGKIAVALKADPGAAARRRAVETRLADKLRAPLLTRTRGTKAELAAAFKAHLGAQGADVVELAAAADIPAAIARYLRAHGQRLRLRAGSDPFLAALPWSTEPDLVRDAGPARPEDSAGLSRATAAAAETGTLLLASGPHNPVTLAFVPDTHLVVVASATIVGSYEEACARLEGALPRTLNLVSGPSRTGDIGGRIVMGAHGPRRLAVLVVEDT